jgi:hypothetical protein
MSVKEYVKQLAVRSGETHRGMCPTCGGSNTFTATNLNGTVKYNCYKASCNVYGALYKGATLDELSRSLILDSSSISSTVPFSLPDSFILPTKVEIANTFLDRYGLNKLFADGRIDIRFDCKQHRVVFLITDPITGVTVDAVGRALEQGVKPKWLRYGTHPNAMLYVPPASTLLTTLSKSVDTAGCVVLVEDAISACTVSDIIASIALLGTNVPQSLLSVLRGLGTKTVIVALDPDAASKSIDIQRQLCYYFDTKVWLIKDDLKYYTRGRLIEEVGELLT